MERIIRKACYFFFIFGDEVDKRLYIGFGFKRFDFLFETLSDLHICLCDLSLFLADFILAAGTMLNLFPKLYSKCCVKSVLLKNWQSRKRPQKKVKVKLMPFSGCQDNLLSDH
jgi:hypothetical protein